MMSEPVAAVTIYLEDGEGFAAPMLEPGETLIIHLVRPNGWTATIQVQGPDEQEEVPHVQ